MESMNIAVVAVSIIMLAFTFVLVYIAREAIREGDAIVGVMPFFILGFVTFCIACVSPLITPILICGILEVLAYIISCWTNVF